MPPGLTTFARSFVAALKRYTLAGTRILVDRLWTQGLREDAAAIDHWCEDLALSTALRQWLGHKPERWEESRKRYRAEIARQPEALAELRGFLRNESITLLFAAPDELHNNAVVLNELLHAEWCAARVPVKTIDMTRGKT